MEQLNINGKLKERINDFSRANILVIGDLIVDHFIWGSVSRISPEAPVPVVNVTNESLLLGGAANVLHNIYDLGGQTTLCGVIGTDYMGRQLLSLLEEMGSDTTGIVKCEDRATTKKTRIVAQNQQVVRFDREQSGPLNPDSIKELHSFLDACFSEFDAVVISDYAKGVICPEVVEHLLELSSKNKNIPVICDLKPVNSKFFHDITMIAPNNHEAEQMSGVLIKDEESLLRAAGVIQERMNCTAVLITRGEEGMTLLEKGCPPLTIPTEAREVFDVTGAGDTVIAALALGLASGLNFAEAATLANYCAGIVVGKIGTATANQKELLEQLNG
ncbi:MAG: D-glycero-beta-D-manno-heptose-7-phosphate kinase [Desulfurivibrionaceae bacterium]